MGGGLLIFAILTIHAWLPWVLFILVGAVAGHTLTKDDR
jgi:predicted branched-subunit amino acid permease